MKTIPLVDPLAELPSAMELLPAIKMQIAQNAEDSKLSQPHSKVGITLSIPKGAYVAAPKFKCSWWRPFERAPRPPEQPFEDYLAFYLIFPLGHTVRGI